MVHEQARSTTIDLFFVVTVICLHLQKTRAKLITCTGNQLSAILLKIAGILYSVQGLVLKYIQ